MVGYSKKTPPFVKGSILALKHSFELFELFELFTALFSELGIPA
jgi:hypothetical protein